MFKDKDIVCFLGDSITASGLWEAEVYQFLRKKYKIKCYNCGVSGAIAKQALNYLYSDCLIYNPDYVVVMYGMNDMGRGLYSEQWAHLEDLEEQRAAKFREHKESYEKIIKACKDFGSEVIICLPTPHDEVTEREAEKVPYQQILDMAAQFQLEMAKKYNCKVVNFKDNMLPMLGKREIIRFDRVHPTPEGYHVMAQIFLKEIGEIEECDFDTPFEFEEWNKERYDVEENGLHKINYVEFTVRYSSKEPKDDETLRRFAQMSYENQEDKEGFAARAYKDYLDRGAERTKLRGEVIKRTIF